MTALAGRAARGTSKRAVALALVSVALRAVSAAAQDAPSPHDAQPERPTVATHAGTVASGWFEMEWGVERDRVAAGPSAYTTPMLLKFGMASHLQFDVTLSTVRPPSGGALGAGDGGIGVKWRLLDGAPFAGDFAIQSSLKFPTGSRERGTGTGTTDAAVLVISSHTLGATSLDVNVGYTRRSSGGNAGNAMLWTVSTGTTVIGPLAIAAEFYGYPGFDGGPSVGFLCGPTYTVHPWFVADFGFIADVRSPQPPALYAGLTWNVGRWR